MKRPDYLEQVKKRLQDVKDGTPYRGGCIEVFDWLRGTVLFPAIKYTHCSARRPELGNRIRAHSRLSDEQIGDFTVAARARRFYEKFGFAADGAVKDSGFGNAKEVRYRLEFV